jgi:uncharacterized protein (TIGR03435 family)
MCLLDVRSTTLMTPLLKGRAAFFCLAIALGSLQVCAQTSQGGVRLVHAESGAVPAFDVATIKPAAPGETSLSFKLSPAYFRASHASLLDLLRFAYQVRSNDQIVGPAWMTKEFFDVDAKAAASEAEQFRDLPPERKMEPTRVMVQLMLAERFQMESGFKMKNLPVYALVIAKGGPKLKPGEGVVHGSSMQAGSAANPSAQNAPKLYVPTLYLTGAHQLTGTGAPIDMLVGWLVNQPELGGRIVVDETVLRGGYDFVLDGVRGPQQPMSAGTLQTDEEPSIFTILQEQLGLKLVPRKAPVEVVVINHVEEPSANREVLADWVKRSYLTQ